MHLNNQLTTNTLILKLLSMKFIRSSFFKFCRQSTLNYDRYFQDIPKLKKTLQKTHFFVTKHQKEFGRQIERCIMAEDWQTLVNGLRCIHVGEIDSWLALRKIAIAFTSIFKTINIKKMKVTQLYTLLDCLDMLKYEPIPKKIQSSNSEYLYDNIEHFSKQIANYVGNFPYFKHQETYIGLMNKLLHTNPLLFKSQQANVESYIIENLGYFIKKSRHYLNGLISKGVWSEYWSVQFKHQLIEKTKQAYGLDYVLPLYFENLSFPNQVSSTQQYNKIKTEGQIFNILEGFGYHAKPNVEINKYEVDVLISDFLVVQYNGCHHYVINSEKQVTAIKHQWKNQVLKKRGYVVSSIAYPQWRKVHLFKDKRKFLVDKIQNDLLKHQFY